jgi:hypothetical protein
VSDIDTAVVDGLKVLDPNGRLEKLPRRRMTGVAVVDPERRFAALGHFQQASLTRYHPFSWPGEGDVIE